MPSGNPNIKPRWKKGESGNPAGLPKGYVRASTILNKLLKAKITVVNAQGKKERKPAGEVLLQKLVANAIDDRRTGHEQIKAAETILNRIEGKAIQPISYPEGIPVAPPILNVMPVEGTDAPA
jgi:hypothetical protein